MGTIQEVIDWFNENKDRLLLEHTIGESLVDKLEKAGVKYTVNDDRSVTFDNCPEDLLKEIKAAKNNLIQ